jgi:hypothetical protein
MNAVRQLTVVPELQLDVTHICSDSKDVCVASLVPKFSPVTVTDAYPLAGVLSSPYETTAASKLKLRKLVPTRLDKVTVLEYSVDSAKGRNLRGRQVIVVIEVQLAVTHRSLVVNAALAEQSKMPKSSPTTVTDHPSD